MKKVILIMAIVASYGLTTSSTRAQVSNNENTKEKVEKRKYNYSIEDLPETDLIPEDNRPNILFVMSDNQSYPHASIYGSKWIKTPGFDFVASEGILFHNVFSASPGCAPSRSSILTGRYPWQNEEAGGHQTLYPDKYITFTDVLAETGYHIGYTGKGCAPFNWKQGGRKYDPAGPEFNEIRYDGADSIILPKGIPDPEAFASNISTVDYTGNFKDFLSKRTENQPFFFWYGAREPHFPFEKGAGIRSGKKTEEVEVPEFLPDNKTIRTDLLDYAYEIEWFDSHLRKMIDLLKEMGELENTIIIVTSDNGMQFPYAIANCYEYGIHVPMAVSWPAKIKKGRVSDDFINLADIAPTILEIANAGAGQMQQIFTKSFKDILLSYDNGVLDPSRDAIFTGRERHSSARWMNLGYPQRAVRTKDFLYIRNYYPERWPAGAPQRLIPGKINELDFMHDLNENGKYTGNVYCDIDDGVSKAFLIENMNHPEVTPFFNLAMKKRPAEELFYIKDDPFTINNIAEKKEFFEHLELMRIKLNDFLRETDDPRIVGPNPDIFENYQRFYTVRPFPRPAWANKDDQ
jgi:N-sulfoglucosamine sulfohydrolase